MAHCDLSAYFMLPGVGGFLDSPGLAFIRSQIGKNVYSNHVANLKHIHLYSCFGAMVKPLQPDLGSGEDEGKLENQDSMFGTETFFSQSFISTQTHLNKVSAQISTRY